MSKANSSRGFSVEVPDEAAAMVAAGAPVAVGVSGGKDSCALALSLFDYLDAAGHTGDRLLIHADLGRIEWRESHPVCVRLAERLGCRLEVVRRERGDMVDRWKQRWDSITRRWEALECVKTVTPFSSAQWRFCTGEQKQAPIFQRLRAIWPGARILSATGIRRDESIRRGKSAVFQPQPGLSSKRAGTSGYDWHPILHWSTADVFEYLAARDFEVHPAYTRFGMSRVSCGFCVLANAGDIEKAALSGEHDDVYRELTALETESTYSFQSGRWLGDAAPALLSAGERMAFEAAKERAVERRRIEAAIPQSLLYVEGWPVKIPDPSEAAALAATRVRIARLLGLEIGYQTAASVRDRFAELIERRPGGRALPLFDAVDGSAATA